jgi:hypothetical protein
LNPLLRIDRRIRELKAIRKANFERVQKEIQSDKRKYRKGHVDPSKVLAILECRVAEYAATHLSDRDDQVHSVGLGTFCEVMSLPERQILRAKASGWMSFNMADKICCRLGVPTATVYPYEQGALWEISA